VGGVPPTRDGLPQERVAADMIKVAVGP
jgi:hypothetical protein